LATSFPAAGAVAVPANQVVTIDGGAVVYTATDERGDFKVGDQLTINGANGTISGATFDKSLFAVMTPYILALEG
jgi:translation elongation factor EF-Tu-like GTPase